MYFKLTNIPFCHGIMYYLFIWNYVMEVAAHCNIFQLKLKSRLVYKFNKKILSWMHLNLNEGNLWWDIKKCHSLLLLITFKVLEVGMVAQFVSIYFLSLCQVVYCKHTCKHWYSETAKGAYIWFALIMYIR